MKKSLRISLFSFSVLGVVALSTQINSVEETAQYQPRKTHVRGATEGFDYFNNIRANQVTGTVDPADVVAAQNFAKQNVNKTNAAIGLNWTSYGPNNIGGRSRTLLFDKDNPNIMYMGSVTGGLYKSTTGGSSWIAVADFQENIGVNSLAQSADGTLYYGTGEGLYSSTSGRPDYSISFVGGGMFKSTDDGQTWSLIPSTKPTNISGGVEWAAIGTIITHPTDKDILWAGTNRGLRRSGDAGATWQNCITITGGTGEVSDVHQDANGGLWVSLGTKVMYSATGDVGGDGVWEEKSTIGAGPGELPRSGARVRVATAPSDPNTVYVVTTKNVTGGRGQGLDRVFKSTDGGNNWTVIGQSSSNFDMFQAWQPSSGLSGNGQANYDFAIVVDPNDSERLIVGGVDLWEYDGPNGWNLISQWFASQPIPWAVHADQHNLYYHPTQAGVYFVVNDGGLFRTNDNGGTFFPLNNEFLSIQFYGIEVGEDRNLIGGTQDNGTLMNDGTGNTFRSAYEVSGGDGGQAAISWLNKDVYFNFTNYNLGRTENAADTWEYGWLDSRMTSAGNPWNTPFKIYETETDMDSHDSVIFIAYPGLRSLGFGNGTRDTFTSVLGRPQESADFITNTFQIVAGGDTVVSDAQGNLSGDGTGMFDDVTGMFNVTFDNPPVAEIIVTCEVNYAAGDVLVLNSNINDLEYRYTLTMPINSGESVQVQDPIQSMYIAGFNRGVYMTRGALDFSENPEWYQLASLGTLTPSAIDVSDDGDVIYVGTSSGRLYILSNVNKARDRASAEKDSVNSEVVVNSVVVAGGRYITSVSANPNDPNKVLVTLGNYGNSSYVFYTTNALSATPTFANKTGTSLPKAPVYASVIDKGNGENAIIGTEFGIYSTDNLSAGGTDWTADNNGFANSPVLDIVQYRTRKSSATDYLRQEGDIFIGGYGKGWYRSTDLLMDRPISVEENEIAENTEKEESLKIYPNPAVEFTKLDVELVNKGDISVMILDMSGRLVKTVSMKGLPQGEHTVNIDLTGLRNGTYIMSLEANNTVRNSKFIVNK